jgi:putative phage-type endonuclease
MVSEVQSMAARRSLRVLAATKHIDRSQWLSLRRTGIGGSDAPAIVGVSAYRGPLQVWSEKVAEVPPASDPPSEAAYWGQRLEEVIAAEYARRNHCRVRRVWALWQHPTVDWIIGDPDRVVSAAGSRGGLEIKTTSRARAAGWPTNEVPWEYQIQALHYLLLTDWDYWDVACLIGGQEYRQWRVEHDAERLRMLREIEREFWVWVERGTPNPEWLDGSPQASQALARMYPPAADSGRMWLLDADVQILEQLRTVETNLRNMQLWRDRLRNQIQARMAQQQADEAIYQGTVVATWRAMEREILDTERFRREHPDLWRQYARVSRYRVFRIHPSHTDDEEVDDATT